MSDLADRLNRALSGRYVIQRELGAGGMATVFLAEDFRHRRRVAIKVLHPELTVAMGGERFLREIEMAAGLNHPHILPLHDSGAGEGLLYYVTPLAEGESLRQRLAQEKQLPLPDALRIAREVAGALDYAHRHKVVHRDIKPENILLQDGHAVVADFGIARALAAAGGARLTATGVVIGTPAYMSPEQTMGSGEVDGRSDQYSLGCVLYEMLTGQPPFTAPTAESMAHQHLSVAPRPVRELRPTVSQEVERSIDRALAKAAADRFATTAELAAGLAARDTAASAPTPTVAPAVSPAGRRLRWLVALGGAVVVTAIALLVVRPWRRASPPTPPGAARSAIAVLPFQNLSADVAHAYFAGGLHDELLTQLAKVEALQVISRTSVMGYQGTPKPLRQIAEELEVGSVVEGSVQVAGGRLRVNVQLIDAATDRHLWAERYDRTLDDAFAIQSDVAQRVAAAVGAALTAAEQGRLAAAPTANAEAYRLYLQGREYYARPGVLRNDREIAQQLFERALALDPNFALGHAALSLVHGQMYFLRYDPSEARAARQREEAETALRLAPHLPEAHAAMGRMYYQGPRDFRRALEELTIALEGMPHDAELLAWIRSSHRRLGNWTEVLAVSERAEQLDPRNAFVFMTNAPTFDLLRRYPEAVRTYERALSLAPDLHNVAVNRAWTYLNWQGQLDTLRAVLARLPMDAELTFHGVVASQRAELWHWERNADSLLQHPLAGRDVFDAREFFLPIALYQAWAHRMRGDQVAALDAFERARVRLDAALRELPHDWRVHAARGLALAGLGRREAALREARWLQVTRTYREDAFDGPLYAQARARILAQAGEADAALDEIERLLAKPSWLSVHALRLDPLWDPIRGHPRFETLLKKYGSPTIAR